MKNVVLVACDDDKENYRKILKGTRKPQKPYLIAEQANVEIALAEYADRITSGTASPLGFTGTTHDYHYWLYDSSSAAVVAMKVNLVDQYSGATCPYCQLDTVSHIDHFLPRSKFPELAISLQNLLMSCDICNSKHKKEHWGNGRAQQVIHPRYNTLPNAVYLEATATYTSQSLVVDFQIRPGLPMSPLLQRHFALMNLNTRYTEKVTLNEVPKISKILLAEPSLKKKITRLQRFVADQITTNPMNSWEFAFYTSIETLVPQVAAGGL